MGLITGEVAKGLVRMCAGLSLEYFFKYFIRKRSFLFPVMVFFVASGNAQEVRRLAQPPIAAAALDFPRNRVLDVVSNQDGLFELVELAPGETVSVAIGFPTSFLGKTFSAEPLDGGTVIVGTRESLTASAEGLIAFSFNAGRNPGIYRLILRAGPDSWLFSFSVPNLKDVTASPKALQARAGSRNN